MKTIFLALAIFGLLFFDAKSQTTFEVELAGYNNVPAVRTAGMGFVEVTVDGDSLFVSGEFENLRGYYWAAFIHYGKTGETGNRIYRLKAELNEEKNGGVFKKENNRFELRPAIRDALRNGNLYVQISSNRNQDGEIRGQIPRM